MSEQLTSNNFENNEFTQNTKVSDYENLISKLKEISNNIVLLEKQFLNKQ